MKISAALSAASFKSANRLYQLRVLGRERRKVVIEFQVRRGCLKDAEILKVAKDGSDGHIDFEICKAGSA